MIEVVVGIHLSNYDVIEMTFVTFMLRNGDTFVVVFNRCKTKAELLPCVL